MSIRRSGGASPPATGTERGRAQRGGSVRGHSTRDEGHGTRASSAPRRRGEGHRLAAAGGRSMLRAWPVASGDGDRAVRARRSCTGGARLLVRCGRTATESRRRREWVSERDGECAARDACGDRRARRVGRMAGMGPATPCAPALRPLRGLAFSREAHEYAAVECRCVVPLPCVTMGRCTWHRRLGGVTPGHRERERGDERCERGAAPVDARQRTRPRAVCVRSAVRSGASPSACHFVSCGSARPRLAAVSAAARIWRSRTDCRMSCVL